MFKVGQKVWALSPNSVRAFNPAKILRVNEDGTLKVQVTELGARRVYTLRADEIRATWEEVEAIYASYQFPTRLAW